jgi:hypothetical protein
METIKSALKVCQPSDEDSTPLDMVRKFVEKELLKNTEDFREFYVNQPSASGQLIVQKIKEFVVAISFNVYPFGAVTEFTAWQMLLASGLAF